MCNTHTNFAIVCRIKGGLKQLLISGEGGGRKSGEGAVGPDTLHSPLPLIASVCLFMRLKGQMITQNQINFL